MTEAKPRIHVLGDSLLKGVTLDEGSHRYRIGSLFKNEALKKLFHLDIENNAQFGSTIGRGQKKLARVLKEGAPGDIVFLEYGGNDCDFNWQRVSDAPTEKHTPLTPMEDFCQAYTQMVQQVRQAGMRPAIMSLPPIDACRYFSWITRNGPVPENVMTFLGDVQLIYRHQELYSDAAKAVALSLGVTCVDIRRAFLPQPNMGRLLCADGIHLNGEGQKLLLGVCQEYITNYVA